MWKASWLYAVCDKLQPHSLTESKLKQVLIFLWDSGTFHYSCCRTTENLQLPMWKRIILSLHCSLLVIILARMSNCNNISDIHWIPALELTLEFFRHILWKIWLWAVIAFCRKSTCKWENNTTRWSGEEGLQWEFAATSLRSLLGCLPLLSSCFFKDIPAWSVRR